MNQDREKLARLQDAASLVFDARSQALRRANEARAETLRKLAALEPLPTEDAALWPALDQSHFAYAQWATARRAELNATLAAQTADCARAAREAQVALGRRSVLDRMKSG